MIWEGIVMGRRKRSIWRRILVFSLMAVWVAAAGTVCPAAAAQTVLPARQVEKLGRGLVAVRTSSGVFVSWRLLATEWNGVLFNVYRGSVKLNGKPLSATNFNDKNGTPGSRYTVAPVIRGKERERCAACSVLKDNFLNLPISAPPSGVTPDGIKYTYSANDCSTADVDGDGEYEIILKWDPSNSKDNSQNGLTGNVFLDAYKLDGRRLWRIDLGRNIRAGAHYTQFMAYDLDGDGNAEIGCKIADGTVDGMGTVFGNASADYRVTVNTQKSFGRVLSGPEYYGIFSGKTGKLLTYIDYDPPRGQVSDWGDAYGNRVDRFLSCVAYLDGSRPSLVICRGYYTRTVLAAYDYRGGKLIKRWRFDSNDPGNSGYAGQGNHNLAVCDVDSDGRDEITYGACCIDDNGKGLYTTGLGHGDAIHVGDLDPDRPGLEVFDVHENKPCPSGVEYRDAKTGKLIWGCPTTRDNGRGLSADIDPRYKGEEVWSAADSNVYNCKGQIISVKKPSSTNFAIWWDGDLSRELLDHVWDANSRTGVPKIDKWDYKTSTDVNLVAFQGCLSNNDTKGTPCLQADLFGDWREEVVTRTADSSALHIYTTTRPTEYRIFTLMQDPVYRESVAWQNVAYNQPPEPGFYLGTGMERPSAPNIYFAGPKTYRSDTGFRLNLKAEKSYCFKVTALDGNQPDFAVAGHAFRVKMFRRQGNDYYYRVTAIGNAGVVAGVYINREPRPSTVISITR